MSSPANTKSDASNRRFASPSRLIPGAPVSIDGVPRKKSASVAWDGRYWEWQEPCASQARPKRTLLQSVPAAVLPRPSVRGPRWRLAGQVVADIVFAVAGFAAIGPLCRLAEFVIHGDAAILIHPLPFPSPALGLVLLYGTLITLLGYSERLYHPDVVQIPGEERAALGKAVFWSTILIAAAIRGSGLREISIAALASSAPLSFLFMLAWRNQCRRAAAKRTRIGPGIRNVLIIGAGELGRKLADALDHDHVRKRAVLGFLDQSEPVGGEVRGRLEDFAHLARSEFVDEIILTVPLQRELAQRIIREARRNQIDIKVVPDLFGFDPGPVILEKFGGVPVLTLHQEQIPAFGLFLKRAVDILFSAAALIVAAPLLGAIALVIKLDSRGLILYAAPRVGLKGRRFQCHKFRTMITNADKLKEQLRPCNERQGATFKLVDDPRITHVGRLLRRYSLDELPQLWNVLQGEMSLVGPRPHPVDDFERYDLDDLQRLEVTPGLTGLWQVTARRDPSFERNVQLDREYIESWTLWQDFRILYKTVSVVLQGSGA